jgi:hypothetical protein
MTVKTKTPPPTLPDFFDFQWHELNSAAALHLLQKRNTVDTVLVHSDFGWITVSKPTMRELLAYYHESPVFVRKREKFTAYYFSYTPTNDLIDK